MKKNLILFLLFVFVAEFSAQQDSIYIQAKLSSDYKTLIVSQDIVYHNKNQTDVNEVKLLNWIAAYKNKGTALSERKLEDRDRELYFSNKNELGKLESLDIRCDDFSIKSAIDLTKENIYFSLNKPLQSGESINLHLEYTLKLPSISFTGYGISTNQVALKYFFLVPDSFEKGERKDRFYNDIEETANYNTHWKIQLELPNAEYAESNLPEILPNYFEGILKTDPEIFISKTKFQKINVPLDGANIPVVFGYNVNAEILENLEFYAPLHLKFINDRTGSLPQKIFISEKFRNKEEFVGIKSLKFWKFNFELFTESEQVDLDYFSILSQKVMEETFAVNKNENHWMTNGLQSYLEIQYLKKFYSESKLLGKLPETKLLGIKPLKLFHASDLNLSDRYGLSYQYMMTQNLDQKIGENFKDLSNFNSNAISGFETGSLFNFVAEKMGELNFETFLKNFLVENKDALLSSEEFLNQLSTKSNGSSNFFEEYISEKQRVNFKTKSFEREDGKLLVRIKKNTNLAVPFQLKTFSENGEVQSYWYDTPSKKTDEYYEVPDKNAYKIEVNEGNSFPESSLRDNYLYTKGIFSNMKKIKFKLLKDIPNPEYNEIYLNPRLAFNAYDRILLGLNFKNKSLFDQNFEYSLTPYYSTGTQEIAGSGSVVYKIRPSESFFRSLNFGVAGSFFHYDFDLAYQKYSAFASIDWAKNPRSAINRSFSLSYNHFEKDLSARAILNNEYDKYNLFNVNFGYSDNKLIHEKYFSTSYQLMEDFNKISAEAFYRWEFAKNKKMSFRLFAGYFLENNTRNSEFDFGISRVSNYSFSYNLVGQSATSGILSQQFILADAGFKSFIDTTANQFITSVNVNSHVWKLFDVYADVGFYKNKSVPSKFIYDTGVKVKIIPDFIEFFLPVYSTLGFEPSFKDYFSRVRFSLVLNFSSLVNTLRRGYY
ncbi:aminopeptidase [Frigoriflavimonas asaccharolytica]|uniref:Aminopeptidase n=1 Tax=Frigoriflavimonas asaccharolytica TaxID=2735899 RepID=A0A8J8K8G4_9FLAO|nr:aminopeptidase [Frigoriflavimonas asaccharolytica]NRS92958.1 hypothetical protein [Frigoriflavimonas asaccharolytica]